jgi:uncharacterized membrane protein YeaQ/YmgE (transglycosylase-associated protein family)
MSAIGWIILGLIAGFVANRMVSRKGDGVIPDILIGVIGGWLMAMLAGADMRGFNLASMLVVIVGAAVLLAITYAVRRAG